MVDLFSLPHLFICYSDEQYHVDFINRLCIEIISGKEPEQILIAFAINSQAESIIDSLEPSFVFKKFITNSSALQGKLSSRLFIASIFKEYKKRKARLDNQNATGNTTRTTFPLLIVLTDHVLDLVIIKGTKSSRQHFIELLAFGANVGIHLLMSGPDSYRNLLNQLARAQKGPTVKSNKNKKEKELLSDQRLGAELILSGEGLIFFRDRNSMEYKKLYAVH
ncbi:MAG: hypothetical protein ABIN36_12070 [Ferruginibacter sp.]